MGEGLIKSIEKVKAPETTPASSLQYTDCAVCGGARVMNCPRTTGICAITMMPAAVLKFVLIEAVGDDAECTLEKSSCCLSQVWVGNLNVIIECSVILESIKEYFGGCLRSCSRNLDLCVVLYSQGWSVVEN